MLLTNVSNGGIIFSNKTKGGEMVRMKVKRQYFKMLGNNIIKSLEKNGFKAQVVPSKKEALEKVLGMISKNEVVGIGGSVTLRQIGLVEALKERGNVVHAHWETQPQKRPEVRKKEITSDVFVSSTNALTMDGKLVNIDGVGNRVTAMIYGPKKVIVVTGLNKIVDNLEAAITRIKMVACSQNAMRLGRDVPCALTGKCADCDSPERMCNVTTIIEKKPAETDMHIILVEEELGY